MVGGGVVDEVVGGGGLLVVVELEVEVSVSVDEVVVVVVEVSVSIVDDVVVDVGGGSEVVSVSDMVIRAQLSIYIEEYQRSVPLVSRVKAQRRSREGIENVALLPRGYGTTGLFQLKEAVQERKGFCDGRRWPMSWQQRQRYDPCPHAPQVSRPTETGIEGKEGAGSQTCLETVWTASACVQARAAHERCRKVRLLASAGQSQIPAYTELGASLVMGPGRPGLLTPG